MAYSFDEKIDRFSTPSAKFNRTYLKDLFGTDNIYPFWIADTDFKSPPQILEAFIEKSNQGVFGYEYKPQTFMPALKNWYSTRFNCEIEASWVQFTPTIMSSVAMALDLFTNENDAIIIQPPVYMEFANTIKKTGRKIIENPLVLNHLHYELNINQLQEIASVSETKAMLICNPHNPGGRVWSRNELKQVVDICVKNNILLISDEIHADVIFSGHKFTSLLSFPEIHNQLIVCYSPAKIFNIASITDSIAIIPNDTLRTKFNNLRLRYNLGRTYAYARIAMEVGFSTASEWVNEFNTYVENNVNYIQTFLSANIPQIQMVKQEGTYLVWLKVDALPLRGKELTKFLGQEAKMGVNDGANFGPEGADFVRMNVACPKEIIVDSMSSLLVAIDKLTSTE